MDRPEDRGSGPKSTFRQKVAGVTSAIGLTAALRQSAAQELTEDEPKMIFPTKRSSRLVDMALTLAVSEHRDLVGQLLSAADGRSKDLLRAAAEIRFRGIRESRGNWIANQMLLAAAHRQPLRAMSSETEAWFQEIERLDQMTRAEGFAYLASLEPRLNLLEANLKQVLSEGDEEITWTLVAEGLQPLLGSGGNSSMPLLRSRTAFDIARIHLGQSLGLHFSD